MSKPPGESPENNSGGIMIAAGHFLASKDGISHGTMSVESRNVGARPFALSSAGLTFTLTAGCSSVYMTGVRGAKPPPAG